jgi:hypothetical protein
MGEGRKQGKCISDEQVIEFHAFMNEKLDDIEFVDFHQFPGISSLSPTWRSFYRSLPQEHIIFVIPRECLE